MIFKSRATRLYTSLCPSIRRSGRLSVTLYFFFFYFAVFGHTAPAQMIKWPQIQPLPTRTCIRPCFILGSGPKDPLKFIYRIRIFLKHELTQVNGSWISVSEIHSIGHYPIDSFIHAFMKMILKSNIQSQSKIPATPVDLFRVMCLLFDEWMHIIMFIYTIVYK